MRPTRCWLIAALLLALVALAQAAPYYQSDFPPEEFKARWQKVFAKIGNDAVALMQGVGPTAGFIVPRQTNEFYYLCGIETPQSYLLLDGRTQKVTLFLPPRNKMAESSFSWRLGLVEYRDLKIGEPTRVYEWTTDVAEFRTSTNSSRCGEESTLAVRNPDQHLPAPQSDKCWSIPVPTYFPAGGRV